MLAIQRRDIIKKQIEIKGEVTVTELSNQFSVSESTIRRDLDILESQQVVTKTYGGAVIHKQYSLTEEPLFSDREFTNYNQKNLIAKMAADLVEEGDVIILDNGTTTSLMVNHLNNIKDLTVVTNSINIAYKLMSNDNIEIIVLGGLLRNRTGAIVGNSTLLSLQSVWANKVFLSCSGVSVKGGVTVSNLNSMEIRKQMIQSAESSILLADSSKIGKRFIAQICPVQKLSTLITEKDFEERSAFEEFGLNVLING